MLNSRTDGNKLVKYVMISTFVLTIIGLVNISGALAQWPYTGSNYYPSYSYYPLGYGGYPSFPTSYSSPFSYYGYGNYPSSSYYGTQIYSYNDYSSNNLYSYNPNVGFTNPYYSPYYSNSSGTTPPTSKLPTEIFDLLSSSDWNTSQKGIELMKNWWGNSSNNQIPNNAYSYSSGNRIPSNTGIGSYASFGTPPSYPATIVGEAYADNILTIQNFLIVRDFILNNGARETYSNMWNNNPYYQFSDELEVFLNPSSQKYINCIAPASEFTTIVIRIRESRFEYFHISLGQNRLILDSDENLSEKDAREKVESLFSEVLGYISSLD